MLDPDLPLSFLSSCLGVGDGAVPAERRLRREAAAAAPEEVRRAGRLQQGGAHHPEGFQEVSEELQNDCSGVNCQCSLSLCLTYREMASEQQELLKLTCTSQCNLSNYGHLVDDLISQFVCDCEIEKRDLE